MTVLEQQVEDPAAVENDDDKPPIAHLACKRCYDKGINPLTSPCGAVHDRSRVLPDELPCVPCVVCIEGQRDHWKCPMCGARF